MTTRCPPARPRFLLDPFSPITDFLCTQTPRPSLSTLHCTQGSAGCRVDFPWHLGWGTEGAPHLGGLRQAAVSQALVHVLTAACGHTSVTSSKAPAWVPLIKCMALYPATPEHFAIHTDMTVLCLSVSVGGCVFTLKCRFQKAGTRVFSTPERKAGIQQHSLNIG